MSLVRNWHSVIQLISSMATAKHTSRWKHPSLASGLRHCAPTSFIVVSGMLIDDGSTTGVRTDNWEKFKIMSSELRAVTV